VVGFRLDATRHRSALEEGWLLQELRDGHGLGLDELVNRLGRSKSWVSRRLALVNVLPAAVQSEVQKGRQSAQVATKYLVPLARANAEQCTRLVSQLDGARLSVRDAGRWYAAWRKADPELKSRLVEHPQLFLQAEASTHGDEDRPPDDEVTAVIGDLGAVAGICVRARTRMDKRDVVASGEVQRRMLGRAFTRAREAFGALSARLEEESV
jgi:ParB-like chromosome segregation protein Spo0J